MLPDRVDEDGVLRLGGRACQEVVDPRERRRSAAGRLHHRVGWCAIQRLARRTGSVGARGVRSRGNGVTSVDDTGNLEHVLTNSSPKCQHGAQVLLIVLQENEAELHVRVEPHLELGDEPSSQNRGAVEGIVGSLMHQGLSSEVFHHSPEEISSYRLVIKIKEFLDVVSHFNSNRTLLV